MNNSVNNARCQGSTTNLKAAALRYAGRGVPVFPVQVTPAPSGKHDKKPLVKDWPNEASADPRKVNMWWSRWPEASIGIVTGERSGLLVLDEDQAGALDALQLPETATARTVSGGKHVYLKWRPGLTNATGGLPDGVDVRGAGGFVVAPPSAGYSWTSTAPPADIPGPVLDTLRKPEPAPAKAPTASLRSEKPQTDQGGPIPDGERNRALFFEALAEKDSGAGHAAVLARVEAVNAERCSPPKPRAEVEKIVRSAMRYPVRSGNPSPELTEAVGEMVRAWWGTRWKGVGGQSDRDVLRVLLELASKYGTLNADGTVDVSTAVRTVALAAGVSYVTVSRGAARRLTQSGYVQKVTTAAADGADVWRLRPPSLPANRSSTGGVPESNVPDLLAPRDAPAPSEALPSQAPCWRHRGFVGKGAGGVEALLEVYGPQTRDELALLMGWKNARELERRYLRTLERNGLAELRADGTWALTADHAAAVETVKATPYAVLLRRETELVDPDTGEVEYVPEERGSAKSEHDRYSEDRERHESHREAFRLELARRAEVESVCFDQLEPAPGPDGYTEDLEVIHPSGCACPACYYERDLRGGAA